MTMRIGILQPGYLPWLGFFEQLARVDLFVIYDDVQFDKGGWRNRNRIKSPDGAQWLTVPVQYSLTDRTEVRSVTVDNGRPWQKKHFRSIQYNYGKAPFYADYSGMFEAAFGRRWEYLIDLDLFFIREIASSLGIATPLERSSTFGITGERSERLIKIVKHCGGTTFYEGAAGARYIDPEMFAREGIAVEFQEYTHPIYQQLHGEFISHLSIIDLLCNCGPASRDILLQPEERVQS